MKQRLLGRWAAPLGAGLLFFLVLVFAAFLRFRYAEAGLAVMLGNGFLVKPVKQFVARFVLTLLLPFYLFIALTLWGMALALGSAFVRGFSDTWTALEGFLITFFALGWVHPLHPLAHPGPAPAAVLDPVSGAPGRGAGLSGGLGQA